MAKRANFNYFENLLGFNKLILKQVLSKGATVVDATCGNGHDTLFLAEHIGPQGKIYCFDIQSQAIQITTELVKSLDPLPNIEFINDSHIQFKEYIQESVDLFIYNLGYLPNTDKNIITQFDTTLNSLNVAIELLKSGGFISILSYIGHDGGKEFNHVNQWLNTLDPNEYSITKTEFILRKNSPILFLIEKL
ncbi:MAG: SAM-dependent methyltransferase [Planctomycetota bacterium]|nr:MAG: SAM-dependent methyltransferase [Planctomycetota bacterium]